MAEIQDNQSILRSKIDPLRTSSPSRTSIKPLPPVKKSKSDGRESEINERIKKDYESTKEVLKSIREIKQDLVQSEAQELKKELDDLQSVDICLMIDLTESMTKHIQIAADTMLDLLAKTKTTYPSSKTRFAFLGYTDFDTSMPFNIIDFQDNEFKVQTEIRMLKTFKSQDYCEDINGALQNVVKLQWASKNRFLFHILDSPCHGNKFSNLSWISKFRHDDYPNGHATDKPYEEIFKKLLDKNIQYSIIPFNDSTVKMIDEFRNIYHHLNLFYKPNKAFKVFSNPKGEDLFRSAFATVTAEISQKMYTMVSRKESVAKPISRQLPKESNNFRRNLVKVKLISSEIPEKKELFKGLGKYNFNVKQIDVYKIEYKYRAFSQGTFNEVHRANLFFSDDQTSPPKKMVLKVPLKKPLIAKTYFFDMLKIHTITKHLATIFTDLIKTLPMANELNRGISFNDIFVVKSEPQNFFCLEPDLGSKFRKFTNNAFFYDNSFKIDIQILLAFSHWSYEFTKESFMVTDLQGTESILTDSTLNTTTGHFEEFGDLGLKGIASFFLTHECNKICNVLKLKKHEDFKYNIPRINTSAMILECKNQSCGKDVKSDGEYCEECQSKLKTIWRKKCLFCMTEFEFMGYKYVFEGKDAPYYCTGCKLKLKK